MHSTPVAKRRESAIHDDEHESLMRWRTDTYMHAYIHHYHPSFVWEDGADGGGAGVPIDALCRPSGQGPESTDRTVSAAAIV